MLAVAELKIKRWRRFCQVGRRHYSSFQKREREFCGFLTKYVKVPRPQILADLHTWRGVELRQQTVSDWMKLADFTSDSGIDRPVYLRICTHLPSQPLVSFFVVTISAFFRELMMVICRKRSDLDLVTTCKRGSELKTRPPTVSTETSSLLL